MFRQVRFFFVTGSFFFLHMDDCFLCVGVFFDRMHVRFVFFHDWNVYSKRFIVLYGSVLFSVCMCVFFRIHERVFSYPWGVFISYTGMVFCVHERFLFRMHGRICSHAGAFVSYAYTYFFSSA